MAGDVYGLGLVLYELLTGARPFELTGRRASEIERVVCEQMPCAPTVPGLQPTPPTWAPTGGS